MTKHFKNYNYTFTIFDLFDKIFQKLQNEQYRTQITITSLIQSNKKNLIRKNDFFKSNRKRY